MRRSVRVDGPWYFFSFSFFFWWPRSPACLDPGAPLRISDGPSARPRTPRRRRAAPDTSVPVAPVPQPGRTPTGQRRGCATVPPPAFPSCPSPSAPRRAIRSLASRAPTGERRRPPKPTPLPGGAFSPLGLSPEPPAVGRLAVSPRHEALPLGGWSTLMRSDTAEPGRTARAGKARGRPPAPGGGHPLRARRQPQSPAWLQTARWTPRGNPPRPVPAAHAVSHVDPPAPFGRKLCVQRLPCPFSAGGERFNGGVARVGLLSHTKWATFLVPKPSGKRTYADLGHPSAVPSAVAPSVSANWWIPRRTSPCRLVTLPLRPTPDARRPQPIAFASGEKKANWLGTLLDGASYDTFSGFSRARKGARFTSLALFCTWTTSWVGRSDPTGPLIHGTAGLRRWSDRVRD